MACCTKKSDKSKTRSAEHFAKGRFAENRESGLDFLHNRTQEQDSFLDFPRFQVPEA